MLKKKQIVKKMGLIWEFRMKKYTVLRILIFIRGQSRKIKFIFLKAEMQFCNSKRIFNKIGAILNKIRKILHLIRSEKKKKK